MLYFVYSTWANGVGTDLVRRRWSIWAEDIASFALQSTNGERRCRLLLLLCNDPEEPPPNPNGVRIATAAASHCSTSDWTWVPSLAINCCILLSLCVCGCGNEADKRRRRLVCHTAKNDATMFVLFLKTQPFVDYNSYNFCQCILTRLCLLGFPTAWVGDIALSDVSFHCVLLLLL